MTSKLGQLDAATRKNAPIARGLLDYFPRACAAVAELSRVANEQHNPGEPMHWARGKSTDHADCIVRHLIDRGTLDDDKQRHSTKVAWRALANLEEELEAADAEAQPAKQHGCDECGAFGYFESPGTASIIICNNCNGSGSI